MFTQSIYHTYKRFRSLQTSRISALPIVILMPHSACNCRCVMCDIWKDNKNLRQLTESDVSGLLETFEDYGTQQVVMSGGEALLNPNFFRFCEMLRGHDIRITLLSTGLTLQREAARLVNAVADIIISLDGPPALHDSIRNIPGAFNKIVEGIDSIRQIDPSFQISGRSVIHKMNFRHWLEIIEVAKEINLSSISFLPADVSSHAFNREVLWNEMRQHEILPDESELSVLYELTGRLVEDYPGEFESRFILESPEKIWNIYSYYAAFYGRNLFPFKKCNAPWVSTVIEADGTVRPCFFHEAIGNIHENRLDDILNSKEAIEFRKSLDIDSNPTCVKCVCYLNLPARAKVH
jgi:MoaA/NifB/PqqE/SkfB family radical SAM enzyme